MYFLSWIIVIYKKSMETIYQYHNLFSSNNKRCKTSHCTLIFIVYSLTLVVYFFAIYRIMLKKKRDEDDQSHLKIARVAAENKEYILVRQTIAHETHTIDFTSFSLSLSPPPPLILPPSANLDALQSPTTTVS